MKNAEHIAIKRRFRKSEAVCEKIIGTFSLLSNKIRFRIVCTLRAGALSVNEIIDIIDCGRQSNVSQQLKLLSMAGVLVKRRKDKQWIYSLAHSKVVDMVKYMESKFTEES